MYLGLCFRSMRNDIDKMKALSLIEDSWIYENRKIDYKTSIIIENTRNLVNFR